MTLKNININEYRTSKWKQLREKVLTRDGYKCARCGKTENLQVHHIKYHTGKKAWEYPIEELITYCKGCHAQEHGHTMPQSGWIYCGMDDLEDLIGECEVCGSALRYEHEIYHKAWGYLIVGSQCADRLTSTSDASEYEEKIKKQANRLQRYLRSPRWKCRKNCHSISFDNYGIAIFDNKFDFTLVINYPIISHDKPTTYRKIKGKGRYKSLEEAKIKAFNVITSGSLTRYMKSKKLDKE